MMCSSFSIVEHSGCNVQFASQAPCSYTEKYVKEYWKRSIKISAGNNFLCFFMHLPILPFLCPLCTFTAVFPFFQIPFPPTISRFLSHFLEVALKAAFW
jgi:hypothetical protein